jgi:hypothetical protein
LNGQFCLPQGITFSTQAEIDQFALDYPDCKQIMGNVTISGPDIVTLNGLSGITSFGKGLYIQKALLHESCWKPDFPYPV